MDEAFSVIAALYKLYRGMCDSYPHTHPHMHTHTHTHTHTLTHTVKKAASTGPVVDIWKKEREMSRRKILSIILVFYLWCVLPW